MQIILYVKRRKLPVHILIQSFEWYFRLHITSLKPRSGENPNNDVFLCMDVTFFFELECYTSLFSSSIHPSEAIVILVSAEIHYYCLCEPLKIENTACVIDAQPAQVHQGTTAFRCLGKKFQNFR